MLDIRIARYIIKQKDLIIKELRGQNNILCSKFQPLEGNEFIDRTADDKKLNINKKQLHSTKQQLLADNVNKQIKKTTPNLKAGQMEMVHHFPRQIPNLIRKKKAKSSSNSNGRK